MNESVEPILKWAGGKRQLLGELLPLVPDYKGKYIEPFMGGGAMFLRFLRKQRFYLTVMKS